jgi:general secretion pathway protein D
MKSPFTGICAALLLAACATSTHYEEARRLLEEGKPEEALPRLEQAVREDPRNTEYRAALVRERERVVAGHLAVADAALRAGRFDEAEAALKRAAAADPANFRVGEAMRQLAEARRHAALVTAAQALYERGDLLGAEAKLRAVLAENPRHLEARGLVRKVTEKAAAAAQAPKLVAPFRKPITLEFRDASLRTVFDMLSRTAGINFVFDRDVRQDSKITIFVRNTSLEDVVNLILTTNQLDRKVLNSNSVLVYPNTPAKQKDYRELVVRSFYLANADVKQASAMIKAMVKAQDLFVDEKLNLLVIKDTPEVIRLTDQLVRTLDVPDSEVVLELDLLEVARSRLQTIGIQYPGSVNLGAAVTGTGAAAATQPIDGPMIFTTANPALVLNLRASVSDANLLANPRIRVKNKEKARIHVGDKVPVFTSTAAANVGVATAVNYLDVGLKLDVEPQIYLQDEVAIKVGLEVSNIIETISVPVGNGSTVAYRLGTRNANTTLQLRDGETQILAGLISDEDRSTSNRIPGLGDIPLLTRLFGSQEDRKDKREIVLLITPRIVRNVSRPEGLMAEMPMGTDSFPGLPPLRLSTAGPGTLALAPEGGAGGNAVPAVETLPEAPPVFELGLAAPAQVKLGQEFTVGVRLSVPFEIREGQVTLNYDPALLEPLSAPARSPGSLVLDFGGGTLPRAVRFRAIAKEAARASVSVADAEATDTSGFGVAIGLPEPAQVVLEP